MDQKHARDVAYLRAAVAQILAAIKHPGSHPEYHRATMERHRAEWPTLWAAIDALLAARRP